MQIRAGDVALNQTSVLQEGKRKGLVMGNIFSKFVIVLITTHHYSQHNFQNNVIKMSRKLIHKIPTKAQIKVILLMIFMQTRILKFILLNSPTSLTH